MQYGMQVQQQLNGTGQWILTIAASVTGVESEGIQQWELLGVLSHRSANEREI